jgi:WD40 repeat protein
MSLVFVSHSTKDKAIALQVLARLQERGYKSLFLDSDPETGLRAGSEWERELYRNLKIAAAVVVLCSPDSMGSRWCFAEITQAKALGKVLFPVVIRPCELVGPLTDRQAIDMAGGGEEEGFRRLFDGLHAAGLDPAGSFGWDPLRPPYPGFLHFDEEDAGIYFGREAETHRVIELLTRLKLPGEPRLAVVIGSSGSGKSSMVRAGVLSRLAKDPDRWVVVPPFRPGGDPIGEFARAIASTFPEGLSRPDFRAFRARLRAEREAAHDVCPAVVDLADDLTMALGRREAGMLVVVDQAEELLQVSDPSEADAFLVSLLRALRFPGGRVFGLMALRSDFLGGFQDHPILRGMPFADFPLSVMSLEKFPQVIEGPAARSGIELEPGLVATMVRDARADDALPLLAFTLREMYERCRDSHRFTLKVYCEDLGGIRGAVARVVARIKTETAPTPEIQHALRRAFLKLVRINDEGQYTRQRARRVDLPGQAAPVLEAFVRARLLTHGGDTVEVTHESLFRVWPELAGWLDESRELMLWWKSIQDEAMDWDVHARSPDRLLSGARVGEARRWLASHADDFAGPQVDFLAASIAVEDDRVKREHAQQAKLRRLARDLATAAIAATVLAVIALIVGGYALNRRGYAITQRDAATKARGEAEDQAKEARKQTSIARSEQAKANDARNLALERQRVAESLLLAAQSQAVFKRYPRRSLLLAVESVRATREYGSPPYVAEQNFRDILASLGGRLMDIGGSEIVGLSVSSDGHWVAIDRRDGTVQVKDQTSPGTAPALLRTLAKDTLFLGRTPMTFAPDGRLLTAGADGTVRVWDPKSPTSPALVLQGTRTSYDSLAISADGNLIAAGQAEAVLLWDLSATATPPVVLHGPRESFQLLSFTKNGLLVSGGREGTVRIWDRKAPKTPLTEFSEPESEPFRRDRVMMGGEGPIIRVRIEVLVIAPDGRVVTGNEEGMVRVYDMKRRENQLSLQHSYKKGAISAVTFTPEGRLVSAGVDGTVQIWDLKVPEAAQLVLRGHDGAISAVTFTPEGRLVSAGVDGTVQIWDLKAPEAAQLVLRGHDGAILDMWKLPNGSLLTAGRDGTARVWDLEEPAVIPAVLRVRDWKPFSRITTIAFAPDGGLAASDEWGTVGVWNLGSAASAPVVVRNEKSIEALAFAPDGRLVTVGSDGAVRVWDLKSPESPQAVLRGSEVNPNERIHLVLASDGRLAIDDSVGRVRIWDPKSPTTPPVMLTGHTGKITDMRFAPDGRLVTACSDGTVRAWNLESPVRPSIIISMKCEKPYESWDPDIIMSFDRGGRLVTGSRDAIIRLWDLRSPAPPSIELRGHNDTFGTLNEGITSLVIAPDGRLVTGGGDRTARVWDIRSPNLPPIVLNRMSGTVDFLAFAEDGRLITCCREYDESVVPVRLWDLKNLTHGPITMISPKNSHGFAVSRKGLWLAVGGRSGEVYLWPLRLDDLMGFAQDVVGRNFTRDEWRQYYGDAPYRPTFPDLPVPPEKRAISGL